MQLLCYDGSFDGFLTAVFEVYEYKFQQPSIVSIEKKTNSLFQQNHVVITNTQKAERVLKKLQQKISIPTIKNLIAVFLSELHQAENMLFRFIQKVLANENNIETNFADADVLWIKQTSRKVFRERHKMEAFIRFKLTQDDIYYAVIEPDFNVLPLIIHHFEKRYTDQKWLIYDAKRMYGAFYDFKKTEMVSINHQQIMQNYFNSNAEVYANNEMYFEKLWQCYFKSTNIVSRKNTKLHLQHMPRRYWKYLVEKQ